MLVKIRLLPKGKKRSKSYSIIAIDSRFKRDSKRLLCNIGVYSPLNKSFYLKFSIDKYSTWINYGAQPTKRVLKLYKIACNNSLYTI